MKVTYRGDHRAYIRYKISNRYYVRCSEIQTRDGISFQCNFENKREDRVKENIKKGNLHICASTK